MVQVARRADWLDGLNSMERSQEAWRSVERNLETVGRGVGGVLEMKDKNKTKNISQTNKKTGGREKGGELKMRSMYEQQGFLNACTTVRCVNRFNP